MSALLGQHVSWGLHVGSAGITALLHVPLFDGSLHMLVITFKLNSNTGHSKRPSKDTWFSVACRLQSCSLNLELMLLIQLIPEPLQVVVLSGHQETVHVRYRAEVTTSVDEHT